MFGFILCIIRISLLPLSSSKKELLARILLLQKENTVLKRSLEVKRKRPGFNFGDRMFYSILNSITDETRYHFTLVKLRNCAEMDQEVYQRVLAFSAEKEESRKTRQIVRYAVTTKPTRQLVRQQLLEFTWNHNGEQVYLIHDGSGEFCNINYDDFDIEEIKISANAPNMNAFAERFIGSARREAFNWFILFNGAQIRNILVEYVGYYNDKRPHQGIAQKVPKGYAPQKQGNIITYPILSGLHHHYERLSA